VLSTWTPVLTFVATVISPTKIIFHIGAQFYLDLATMAAEIWTINLTCDGAELGQEYVQREMDKDEICFFNLIDMIKEYGYTSMDNLYYKSKDGMVVIEFDNNVMEMLEEYESEKEVTLFVTREKIAFMVPTKSRSASSKTEGTKTI